jgi:hypothetical protein
MIRRAGGALALIVLLGAGLTGCTDDPEKPTPSASASAGASNPAGPAGSLEEAAAQVNQQYLTATAAGTAAPIASVRGEVVASGGKKVPGTAELLAVQAGPTSTAVRWRMASDDPDVTLVPSAYSDPTKAIPDTAGVILVAKQANLLLKTGHWAGKTAQSGECTCSWSARDLGPAGLEMSILYPALPTSVTEVELRVPGFPSLSGPVTRS